jgi:putative redox protein
MQAPISEIHPPLPKGNDQSFPVDVNWVQDLQFIANDENKHSIVLDTSPEAGGHESGPTPGRLLLMAVAGCTAMDVVDILRKSRQKLTRLSVQARAVQNKDYPKYYKEIHLRYILKGKDLEKSRVERAIRLSEEKYCSVGATVSGKAKIFIEYQIQNDDEKAAAENASQPKFLSIAKLQQE